MRGAPEIVRLQASGGGAAPAEAVQAGELSLSSRVQRVHEAMWKRNRGALAGEDWYVVEVFDGHVIARRGEQTFRVPYTLDGEAAEVSFGEAEEVAVEYVPVSVQQASIAAQLVAAEDREPTGLEWEVDIIREGPSLARVVQGGKSLPVVFSAGYLESLVPLLEGVPVYALDDTASGHKRSSAEKRQEQLAGWIDGVKLEAGVVRGRLHFNPAGVGLEKAKVLAHAWQKGNRRLFGLSIDSRGTGAVERQGRQEVYVAQTAVECDSVDVVTRPAAGGQFTKLAASAAGDPDQESKMNKREKLLHAIRASRPDALQGKDEAALGLSELLEMATPEELATAFGTMQTQAAAPLAPPAAPSAEELGRQAYQVATEMRQMEEIITASRLPERTQGRLRKLVAPGATAESIQAAVDEAREELAAAVPPRVVGLGFTRSGVSGTAEVIAEPVDKLQAALDRAFGLEPENAQLKTIKPVRLRELYDILTCGQDESVYGELQASQMAVIQAAGFDSNTLPSLLANTMNRRLVADYAAVQYGEDALISTTGSARDFKPQTAVRFGYLGNLPVVNTDTQDYPSVNAYSEEKATYSLDERGLIVEVSRRHIINDDLEHVAKIPSKIARAARRTFAEFVFSFLIDNPVITLSPGTLNWFHATRNNLLTVALGVAGLNAAATALYKQTEPDSGKRLGLRLHSLFIPQELEAKALLLNTSEKDPDDVNKVNPWRGKFGANNERIHVVPSMTDANDWAVAANPQDGEIIEVKFLNGQREPVLVMQDQPGQGKVFTRGMISLKAFHDYSGTPVDFRTVVKSVVANV